MLTNALRDAGRAVARACGSAPRATAQPRPEQMPVLGGWCRRLTAHTARADDGPVDGRRGSAARRTSPSSSARWPRPASRSSRGSRARRSRRGDPGRGARLLRDVSMPCRSAAPIRPPLRRLLEPHLPLQPRLRALLSRRRRQARRSATETFADRSELGTEQCFRVIDDIAAFAPECVTILTGGEPLLRRDILEIVRYAPRSADCGSSSAPTASRSPRTWRRASQEAGVRGLSLSLDALDPDASRPLQDGARRLAEHGGGRADPAPRTGLPVHRADDAGAHNRGELEAIADFAHDAWAPRSGTSTSSCRPGAGTSCPTSPPREYDEVLAALYGSRRSTRARMLVNAKCAPHYIKTVLEHGGRPGRDSSGGASDQDLRRRRGRLPGGHALHGDPAQRRRHALPVPAGLRGEPSQAEPRGPLDVLRAVRRHPPPHRARRTLRRLRDERPLRRLPRPRLRDDRRRHGRGSALHAHARHVRRLALLTPHVRLAPLQGACGDGDPVRRRIAGTIAWDDAAAERMKKIPAFVRGMVVKAVEDSCRKNGVDRVTAEELERSARGCRRQRSLGSTDACCPAPSDRARAGAGRFPTGHARVVLTSSKGRRRRT